MAELDLPDSLSINAWSGEIPAASPLLADAPKRWSTVRAFPRYSVPLAAEPLDKRDWRDPRVGWGLVLPDNDALPQADRATANDAPDPIRALVASRPNAVVLRYQKNVATQGYLRRYYANRAKQDLAITGGNRGTAEECIPQYLLIHGGPQSIPWEFQYRLSLDFFVGRLDLEGQALERYVEALVSEWSSAGCHRASPVIWSTDHAPNDITHLMRLAIGEPLKARFTADDETRSGLRPLFAGDATSINLITKLGEVKPALVVTTSHGMTGPLSNPAKMKTQIGWLVDADHMPINPDVVLAAWEPDGAIWYSHACCSAGGDGRTLFKDLVPAGSPVAQVLQGVAELGPAVASFPRALLGAKKPLRAFIGHVEPTFDWTLQAQTRQFLTNALLNALYDRMYLADPEPVGLAFYECYRLVGSLFAQWDQQVEKVNSAETPDVRNAARLAAMRTKLTALDRQAMVIIGDPTVALPRLKRD
jgi:hypothetical protein